MHVLYGTYIIWMMCEICVRSYVWWVVLWNIDVRLGVLCCIVLWCKWFMWFRCCMCYDVMHRVMMLAALMWCACSVMCIRWWRIMCWCVVIICDALTFDVMCVICVMYIWSVLYDVCDVRDVCNVHYEIMQRDALWWCVMCWVWYMWCV